ncbi:MAG: CHAT domain-containing protein [Prevotellaceae bacterium]|nr:CHAT domain-containing protein [Prevotellaceae bacterium]
MCCGDANEIEELGIVCSEIVRYFGTDDDDDSRQLVALCSDFEVLCGEKSLNVDELSKAALRMEELFGKDSLMSLRIQNEIGYVYKKNREFDKATELCRRLYLVSSAKYGRYSYDTIVFQKNYVMNLALSGKYRKALSEAKILEKAVEKCPEKNRCPDINECFLYIYMGLGKKKLAEQYGNKSFEYNRDALGEDDLTTAKGKFILAAKGFSENHDIHNAFLEMMNYMTIKEQWLCNLFLLSSDITREKAFDIQNRGEYDLCLGLALSDIEHLSKEELISLWETACNYKSLIGDCELLHGVISRNPAFLQKERELKERAKSGNAEDITDIRREILDMTHSYDFSGYVNSVHVADIQSTLKHGELLLDYYCVHFSDLQVYACFAVTSDEFKLFPVASIDEIESLVDGITEAVCNEKDSGSLRKVDDVSDLKQSTARAIIQKMKEKLRLDVGSPKRLIVCPDGELYRLPFDVLSDDCEVVYVTNAKDIVRGRNSAGNESMIKDVYVFADPLFHQNNEQAHTFSDEQSEERSESLSRLPGTYVEANIISRIFAGKVRRFVHENASRKSLLENSNADILHIGSHATGTDGGIIYLSGADDADTEEPGFVTSRDIAKLDMSKTKLAVLSACQTGIGEYRNYLGVRGLRRSFQLAGADNVVSTMWSISDLATAIFMYAFYSKYNECADSITALYFAKKYMKTATVEKIKAEIYPEISDILLKSGNTETYRELRDMIGLGDEADIPFASPYYWAAFSLYKSFMF